MNYPSTYNEMIAWVGVSKFRDHFGITDEQAEEFYGLLSTKKMASLVGTPDGKIVSILKDGTKKEVRAASNLDSNMYESVSVTAAGLVITYTAAYLAAQRARSSSSGGSGSNNNNNNNNNNN